MTPTVGFYPKEVAIRGGEKVTVRPLLPDDAQALLAHFLSLPEEERHFLKEDVSSPQVIEAWVRASQGPQVWSLVALSGHRIVAQGAVVRRRGRAYAHVADVRLTVSPSHYGRGLGTALLRELCDLAAEAGLELLLAQIVPEVNREILRALEWIGFVRGGMIEGAAIDLAGNRYDLFLLYLPLSRWREWTRF